MTDYVLEQLERELSYRGGGAQLTKEDGARIIAVFRSLLDCEPFVPASGEEFGGRGLDEDSGLPRGVRSVGGGDGLEEGRAHCFAERLPVVDEDVLWRLHRHLRLSLLEIQFLLLALGPEISSRLSHLCAWLNNDSDLPFFVPELAARLLPEVEGGGAPASYALDPARPLVRLELLWMESESERPWCLTPIRVARPLLAYLEGAAFHDPILDTLRRINRHDVEPADLQISAPGLTRKLIGHVAGARANPADKAPLLAFSGPRGSGRRLLAELVEHVSARPLLPLSAAALSSHEEAEKILRAARREALLNDAWLLWLDADDLLFPERVTPTGVAFQRSLTDGEVPHIVVTTKKWDPAALMTQRPSFSIALETPDVSRRVTLWTGLVAGSDLRLSAEEIALLASNYRMTPGDMHRALRLVRDDRVSFAGEDSASAFRRLGKACRRQVSHRLESLAQEVRVDSCLDDLVLPPLQKEGLKMIVRTLRHRALVHGAWGFSPEKGVGTRSLLVFFSGPPGTGKTMAAGIIARELELDLFRIDLSSVVSKYIGETEKNLEQLFAQAEAGNAMLFFDEADALFGKRSEVKDAHDRYANQEVSWLLQRIETFDGVVILASNLKNNLDAAFSRRLHCVIDFPFPDEEHRRMLWMKLFPPQAPRSDDIDFDFLVKKIPLSGGHIRNMIQSAAFMAAGEGEAIAMSHLVRAAAMEYQKLGRLVTQDDFGPYYSMTRSEYRPATVEMMKAL